jgi:hypothetical protein
MAMNPMQRRARNSFLAGMLITLVIMAIVVIALLYKINQLNEDKEKLIALQQTVYVAAEDISSGGEVTENQLVKATVITDVPSDEILSMSDFVEYDEDGNEFAIEYVSKVDLPAGTIITKDMVAEAGDETTDSQRIQEYNMITLPSELKNGQYIDIRLKLPSGADYIVASKKKVLQCTSDTIWLKVDEAELLTIGCAVYESYQITGSKLYATMYSEAGIQATASITYTPNNETWEVINRDPNINTETRNEMATKYNDQDQGNGRIKIDSTIVTDSSSVRSGVQSEASSLKSAREAFVSELDGTGEVGRQ